MTSVESKIENYERKIVQHEAEIDMIKKGEGFYSQSSYEQKVAAIKSKEDAIHDCNEQLKLLRQQQQGKNLFLYSSVFF